MAETSKEAVARLATSLKTNPAWQGLLAALKAVALRDWANTQSGEADKREGLYRDIQAIGRLEAAVQAVSDNAEIEARKEAAATKKAFTRKGT